MPRAVHQKDWMADGGPRATTARYDGIRARGFELGTDNVAMKPVITAAQAAEWDAQASDPVETLMERAGLAVAVAAAELGAAYGRRVVVLTGPGNNGGDGYIAAKYLARRGAAVEVVPLGEPRSEACRWAAGQAIRAGVRMGTWRPPRSDEPDLVIDALFGAGFRGALPSEIAPWTETSAPVVSVDVPSGLDATTGAAEGPGFEATRTVTVGALKVGHLLGSGPRVCGDVRVADIGLPQGVFEFRLCETEDAPRPRRSRTAHKWSAGSVMVVGGSPGISGAAILAARSALNAGAGAVRVVLPGELGRGVEAPELMTSAIGSGDRFAVSDAAAVLDMADRFDVLAVGPGLGPGQTEFVAMLVEGRSGPLVLDADGLNAIADVGLLAARSGPTVITPHAGEFRRLAGTDAGYEAASRVAQKADVVILLKGGPTFVAGRELWAVASGGPELATIGTGDVLTGMVAALWARGLDAETAARSGAYWHGRAGAARASAGTVTADTLAEEIRRWSW
jgi:NAD(P)H-hydrate epimerase